MGYRRVIASLVSLVLASTPNLVLAEETNTIYQTTSKQLITQRIGKDLVAKLPYGLSDEVIFTLKGTTNSLYVRDSGLEQEIRDGRIKSSKYKTLKGYGNLSIQGSTTSPYLNGENPVFPIKPQRTLETTLKTKLAFIEFNKKEGITYLYLPKKQGNLYQISKTFGYEVLNNSFFEFINNERVTQTPLIELTPQPEDQQAIFEQAVFRTAPRLIKSEIDLQLEKNPKLDGLDLFAQSLGKKLKIGSYGLNIVNAEAYAMKLEALHSRENIFIAAADIPIINEALIPPHEELVDKKPKEDNTKVWLIGGGVVLGVAAAITTGIIINKTLTIESPDKKPKISNPTQTPVDINF